MLAAWLGDINPSASRAFLESHGIPNFYTPENAVEAFSFLCAYRRNQSQLMQVPAAAADDGEEPRPDLEAAAALRSRAVAERRTILTEHEAKALLRRFSHSGAGSILAKDREAAVQARARSASRSCSRFTRPTSCTNPTSAACA